MAFSSGPRHSLYRHPAASAVYPSQGINKVHGNSPQRHELEPPLRQPVVTRPWSPAARANRPAILAGIEGNFQRRAWRTFHPLDFSVHEGLVRFDPIEDSLQLHPVVAPGEMVRFATPSLAGIPAGCICLPIRFSRYTDRCLAKRRRALLASNPTRDNQIRAGEWPAGPTAFRRQGLFFRLLPIHLSLSCLRKRTLTLLTKLSSYPLILLKTPKTKLPLDTICDIIFWLKFYCASR